MAEHWKSTPKYWCKHCGIYVRDTKLERTNHEATGKHQGNLKRFLRDLHRGHEREERDKDRARREVERLNGVVSGGPCSSSSSSHAAPGRAPAAGGNGNTNTGRPPAAPPSGDDRKRQMEELAGLGVAIPDGLRGDLAMAGEWTVTRTRVVERDGEEPDKRATASLVTGVRKREQTEEEREEEEAVAGLFRKKARWGRDLRNAPGAESDEELDKLLAAPVGLRKRACEEEEGMDEVKKEEEGGHEGPLVEVKGEPPVKQEDCEDVALPEKTGKDAAPAIGDMEAKDEEGTASAPAVVFKKRKPKNVRQK